MRFLLYFRPLIRKSWWKYQFSNILFLISLSSLTLLVAWWAIFMEQSIRESRDLKYENLRQMVNYYSHILGGNKRKSPEEGTLPIDHRLEIMKRTSQSNSYAQVLLPHWGQYVIQPKDFEIEKIQKKSRSLKLMIIGESSLLLLLILVSGGMLFRLHRLEKRSTQEMHDRGDLRAYSLGVGKGAEFYLDIKEGDLKKNA